MDLLIYRKKGPSPKRPTNRPTGWQPAHHLPTWHCPRIISMNLSLNTISVHWFEHMFGILKTIRIWRYCVLQNQGVSSAKTHVALFFAVCLANQLRPIQCLQFEGLIASDLACFVVQELTKIKIGQNLRHKCQESSLATFRGQALKLLFTDPHSIW